MTRWWAADDDFRVLADQSPPDRGPADGDAPSPDGSRATGRATDEVSCDERVRS